MVSSTFCSTYRDPLAFLYGLSPSKDTEEQGSNVGGTSNRFNKDETSATKTHHLKVLPEISRLSAASSSSSISSLPIMEETPFVRNLPYDMTSSFSLNTSDPREMARHESASYPAAFSLDEDAFGPIRGIVEDALGQCTYNVNVDDNNDNNNCSRPMTLDDKLYDAQALLSEPIGEVLPEQGAMEPVSLYDMNVQRSHGAMIDLEPEEAFPEEDPLSAPPTNHSNTLWMSSMMEQASAGQPVSMEQLFQKLRQDRQEILRTQQMLQEQTHNRALPSVETISAVVCSEPVSDMEDSMTIFEDASTGSGTSSTSSSRVSSKGSHHGRRSTSLADSRMDDTDHSHNPKFREYQTEQWGTRYDELVAYYNHCGHSSVPHTDQSNACLARWVKRQRYQYKLRQEGKLSAMTDVRIRLLESLDFVWDSHGAAWEDRIRELEEFKARFRHCNVPSNYRPNASLASWVKCQRRQYRLYKEGKKSSMTPQRIEQLERMGLRFNLRTSFLGGNSNNNKNSSVTVPITIPSHHRAAPPTSPTGSSFPQM